MGFLVEVILEILEKPHKVTQKSPKSCREDEPALTWAVTSLFLPSFLFWLTFVSNHVTLSTVFFVKAFGASWLFLSAAHQQTVCVWLPLTFSPICIHKHTLSDGTAVTARLVEHKRLLAMTYVGWMLTGAKECSRWGKPPHTHTHMHTHPSLFGGALKNAVRAVDLWLLLG